MMPLTKLAALLAALSPLAAPLAIATPQGLQSVDAAAAAVEQLRPETPPRIKSVSFSGSGCPQGHAPKVVGGDEAWNGLGLRFSQFRAVSPGTAKTSNCQAHITADGASGGWQMSLSDVWVEGKGKLQPGNEVRYYTTVFYSESASKTLTLEGEVKNKGSDVSDGPITIHSSAGSGAVWSSCTTEGGSPGILNINFRVSLPNDDDERFDVQSEKWAFKWRRC